MRRLVLDDYVLVYQFNSGEVWITTIRHGRMLGDVPDVEDHDDYETDRPQE